MTLWPNNSQTQPRISSGYGPRSGGYASVHEGVDLIGFDEVYAVLPGVVTWSGFINNAAGRGVIWTPDGHPNVEIRYFHQASETVRKGARIAAGQHLGKMGATGNATGKCLHFEVRVDGRPVDPIAWLNAHGAQPARPGVAAPAFPLPAGHYFGPKSGPVESVSGYFSHREDLRAWQQRMRDRGWNIDPDGLYGDQTGDVCEAFQREKGLTPDRKIGPITWRAAWELPIT